MEHEGCGPCARRVALLIEDDPDYSLLVQTWITHYLDGWACRPVGTVEEAIETLSVQIYDLIIMDLGLPGYTKMMALFPITDAVKAYRTPILVLSGLPQNYEVDAVQAGAKMFLAKNNIVTPEKFVEVVKQVIAE